MCRRCFSRPSTRVSRTAGKSSSDFFFPSAFPQLRCFAIRPRGEAVLCTVSHWQDTAPGPRLGGLYGDGPIESRWKGRGAFRHTAWFASSPATSHRGACGIERRIAAPCRFSSLLFHLATRCVCIRCTASAKPWSPSRPRTLQQTTPCFLLLSSFAAPCFTLPSAGLFYFKEISSSDNLTD